MTSHLIASTATAMAALAAVYLLRRQRAALRYTILLIALLRFALPTPWLIDAGSALSRAMPARVQPALESVSDLLLRPILVSPLPQMLAPAVPEGSGRIQRLAWPALWIAGAVVCLALWLRRTRREVPSVRPATDTEREAVRSTWDRLEIRHRVGLRIVDEEHVPGAQGWRRPVVLLPEHLADELTPAELDAVLAHELAHVERRDNLWAAIVRAIVSVFWFHPLAWWIEHRLLAERETACDEMVLARGADPEVYVSGIAKVCRTALVHSGAYAGISGSNLRQRLAHIRSGEWRRSHPLLTRALPATLAALTLFLPVAGGFLRAQPPEQWHELTARIEIHMTQGDPNAGIELLLAELAKDPSNRRLRLGLGNLYVRTGRYDEAIALFSLALREDPDSADVLFRLAEAYRRKGDLAMAIEMFRRASQAAPSDVQPLLQLALLLDGTGETQQARRAYEQILLLQPAHPVAANNLAYLLANGEDPDRGRALSLALTAARSLPDSADVADTVGWVYLKQNKIDEAIAGFGAAVLKEFNRADLQSHLLMALDQKQNHTAQTQELQILLRSYMTPERDRRIGELLRGLP